MKKTNSLRDWQSMESLEARLMLSGDAPVIVFSDTPYTIDEGDPAVFNASGTTDNEGDTLTYNWDLNNDGTYGQANAGAQPSFDWATLQAAGITDNGTYTIGLQVDDGTSQVTQTVTLTVNNAAPTVALTGDADVDEEANYTLNVDVSDPGDDTASLIVVNWGDGSNAEVVSSGDNTHMYESEGSYDITVSVMDEDGYHTDVSTKSISVNNAAPTIVNGATVDLAAINEDVVSGANAGQTVNTLFLPHYEDAADDFAGVAIISNGADAASEGAWQYSIDDGTSWNDISEAVDASTAIVLGTAHMLRFQPVANFAGTPGTLDARLWDGGGTAVAGQANDITGEFGGANSYAGSAITTSISVTALTDAPSFSSSAVTDATEDVAYTYNITATDADTGDTLTITALSKPTWLTFTDNGDGTATLTGTPTNDEVGDHSISLQVSDVAGNLATQPFTLTVANANDNPTLENAIADQTATEDAAFSFQFSADTFDDVDVSDTLTYTATQADDSALPAWLTFTAGTRTFSGTPTNSDVGTLSVKVTADDGNGGTITDTFDITISNVNDAPTVANAIADQNATEDAAYSFQIPADAFNDVDSGDSLTYTATQADDSALPAWLTFTAGTRTFSGTPANGDVGTISVKVTATDGSSASVTDTFNLVVANANDAPTLDNPISDQSATEDVAFNFTFAANTFSDVDVSDTLTYSATLADDSALPGWLTFTAGTRSFSGTPTNGDVGTISVKVTADDGTVTVTDTFDITIAAVNDAPVITIPAGQTMDEDSTLTFSTGNGNLISIADVDAATNDLAITVTVSNGTLTVVLDGTATVTAGSNASATMTISGTVTEINNTLDGMVYTPTANYDGGDSLSISIDDGGNVGSGGALTDSETVAISFNSIDDAAVVNLDANDNGGNSPDFAVAYTENGAAVTIVDVDASISDVDTTNLASLTVTITSPVSGDTLSATVGGTSITSDFTNGVLTLTGPDTVANFQQVLRTIQYSNSGDNPGSSKTITIVANDGNSDSTAATCTVTITESDDAPSAITNTGITLNEGATTTVTTTQLTVTDADSADSAILFTVVTAPTNGAFKKSGTTLNATDTFTLADIVANNMTYVHDGTDTTTDSLVFTYEDASSGAVGGNQTFTFTVTPVNDAPVLSLDANNSGGTAPDATGAYTENAGAADIVVDSSMTDSESDDIVSMTITITDFVTGDTLNVTEGGLTKGYTTGVLSLTGTASLATYMGVLDTLTFVSSSEDPGSSRTITVVVNDGTDNSNTATLTLNITESDDTPVEAANTGAAVNEDVSHAITTGELSYTDPDNTTAEIIYTIDTAPTHGTLYNDGVALNASGTFTQADLVAGLVTYTNSDGTSDSFAFNVGDGTNTVAGQSFALTVTPVNDTPVEAANTGLTLNEAATGTITTTELQYTDAEQAAGSLTYTLSSIPTNGALKLSGTTLSNGQTFTQDDIDNNLLTYVHDAGETTSDSFGFSITDGAGGTVTAQTFTITVTAVNDAPVLTKNLTRSVDEGASVTITAGYLLVLDNDVTTDAEIVFTVETAPVNGTLYKNGVALVATNTFTQDDIYTGYLTYTHDGGETSSDTFVFSVSDSDTGTIGNTTFNITVVAQNDDPSVTENSVTVTSTTAISDISEDDTITFSAANSNLIAVVDPDASASNITVALAVTRGTLNITDASGATISSGADESAAMTLTGTVAQINTALDGMVYTPSSPGAETISITMNDGGNTGAGGGSDVARSLTFTVNANPTIDANTGVTLDEAASVTIVNTMLAVTDTDNTSAQLTFTVVTKPANGTLYRDGVALDNAGTFTQDDINNNLITYTHDGGETITDTLTFSVSDGSGGTIGNTNFTFTVTAINDAPVVGTNTGATFDEASTGNTISSAMLEVTDAEQAAAARIFTLTAIPTNGTLKLNGSALAVDGTFTQADIAGSLLTYDHDGGETTSDSFSFTVSDGVGGTIAETSFAITVTPVNDTPVLATNTGVTLDEAATVTVANTMLALTDAEQAATALTYTVVTKPANGTLYKDGVALDNAGTFTQADIDNNLITYTHDGGETTTDTLTFSVSDGDGGTIGNTNFTFTVTAINDAPVVGTNTGATFDEASTGNTISSVMLEVTDAEQAAAARTFTLTAIPTNGTLKRDGVTLAVSDTFTQADIAGSLLTYDHDGGETTSDSFSFTVADGDGGTIAETSFAITVTPVNDTPVLATNTGVTLDEAATVTVANTMLALTDAEQAATALTYTVVTKPANGTLYKDGVALDNAGTFTQADIDNNLITYTHDGGETTTDTLTFSVSDGDGGTIGNTNFTFTVTAINDAPVVGTNTGATFDEASTGNTISSVMLEVTDAEQAAAARTFTLTAIPTNGTLKLDGVTLAVSDTFTQADIAGNLLTYDHDDSETTSDSFSFTVSDGDGGTIAETSFAITVTPVDDAPVAAVNTGQTVTEDVSSTIPNTKLSYTDDDNTAAELTFTITTKPAHGTMYRDGVALDNAGTFTQDDIDNNLVTYTNDDGAPDSFSFTLSDGNTVSGITAFNFTVAAQNDLPTVSTNAGLTLNEAATGTIGTAQLAYTDPEQGAIDLTYAITALPANGSIARDGVVLEENGTFTQDDINNDLVTYVHAGGENTSDSFTFTISDGVGGNVTGQTFAITINAVSDTPVEAVNTGLAVTEEVATTIPNTALQYTDVDNTAVQIIYTVTVKPAHGTLYDTGVAIDTNDTFTQEDIDNGLIYYTNDDGADDSFTFTVTDSTTTTGAATFSFTTTAVNDAPTVDTNGGVTLNEGATTTVGQAQLETTDVEQAAAELTYTVTTLPTNGTLKLSGVDLAVNDTFTQDDVNNNLVTYVHDGSETTSDSFVFSVADGAGGSVTAQTFNITVTPQNDDPTLSVNAGVTVTENDTATVITNAMLQAADAEEADPANITFTISAVPSNGTLKLDGVALINTNTFTQADINNNLLTYDHDGSEDASETFTFTVDDGSGGSLAGQTFTITVTPVNEDPTISFDGGAIGSPEVIADINEEGSITFNAGNSNLITVADVDAASADLTVTITAPKGTITLNAGATGDLANLTGDGTATVSFDGTITEINAALDGMVYTATAPNVGAETITITVNDNGNTGAVSGNDVVGTLGFTINDAKSAPILDTSAVVTLTAVDEDTASGSVAGNTVIEILATGPGGDPISLPDGTGSGEIKGIAVTGVDDTNGTWEYSTNTGSTWTAFGAVADNNAVVFTPAATNMIRFVADADYTGTPELTFRAWDGTDASSNGDTAVDASTNGGTTAFSAEAGTLEAPITNVNDAPVFDASTEMTITAISEDVEDGANTGMLVSDMLATGAGSDPITDIDPSAVDGIAVIGVGNDNGVWEFSTDGGTTWTAFGAPGYMDATLLTATANDKVRFVPDADWNGTASISFVAWDASDGKVTGQTGVNIATEGTGGINAYSTAAGSATITVNPANDSPIYDNSGDPTVTTVIEDVADGANTGMLISDMLATAAGGDAITDIDSGAVDGIAVTAVDDTNGQWQFSVDAGTTWTAFGAVSDTSSVVLSATANDKIRFVPTTDWYGTATISFQAWDTSDSNASGTAGVDATVTGDTVAFSAASDVATITVTLVDDVPTVDNAIADQTATDDVAFSFIVPADAFGNVDPTDTLTYSATLADDSALPAWLSFDAGTRTFSGTPADGDVGTIDVKVTATDSITPVSDTFQIVISDANDAPVIDTTEMTVTTVDEDVVAGSNAGMLVSDLLATGLAGDPISDADAAAADGIAVTAVDDTNGQWQFSTDTGTTWTAFGAVAADSAVLLTATASDMIRFQPVADFDGEATISFSAWDGSDAASTGDTTVDTTTNGGTTAFSTATGTARITITPVNDTPVLDNAIADQNATDDVAFSYVVPADAFSDVDTSDTLTYSATLADDSALPSWLSFDAGTRTFSGTPADGDVGAIDVKVTVSDSVASASDTFQLTVADANDAPTLDNALVDQDATEDSAFTYAFAANSFGDVDAGDSLTYTAKLADDSALPGWLSFDAGTRTFSGTPANDDVGTLEVKVTATDTASSAVSDTFTITIANVNDAPTVANAIADQPAAEWAAFNYVVPADAFADVDAGDSLTYTASQADDSALPAWLSFDAGTRTFSGTPENGDEGTVDVKVTATDGSDASVSDTFTITVANTNDAPTLDNALIDQDATEDSAFSYTFAENSFSDPDNGDTITYTATQADDSALPAWLSFDAGTRTFSGTPNNAAVGTLDVKVTATDTGSEAVSDTFTITIANVNDAPTVDNAIADQNADEDAAFSFIVPADAFGDVDTGDTLTYTASLADDSALPAWLSFDAGTRTFSGTPTNDEVGAIEVKVTATDGSDAAVSDTFTLTVVNTNDAPTLDNALVDQDATEDSAFSYAFAADSFGDVDASDTLTYTASLADDSALPGWLSFDGGTRTFSGTPTNDDVGTIEVKVIADDGTVTVSDTFTITIANTNDTPTLDNALVDQDATEDAAFSYIFAANSFSDVDAGDTIVYTATQADDSALPAWLDFDAGTLTFSGTPANDDVGTLEVKVTATDDSDAAVSDTFTITIANTNDAPVAEDQALSMPEDAAVDDVIGTVVVTEVDAGDTLTYSISGGTDAARFSIDSATGEVTLVDASNIDFETTTSYSFELTVQDLAGLSDTATVTVNVTNVNEGPTLTGGEFVLPSNAEDADVVGAVTVADVDAGDTFTYAITDGDTYGAFAVNAAGQIIVADAADLVANTIVTLTVQVTDAGGLTDTAEVVVTVTSVNLVPTFTSVTTNASLLTGDTVAVKLNVANTGAAKATETMPLTIYAVPTGGGDNIELYSSTVSTGISAGSNKTYSITLTIPANDVMPIGTYTLLATTQYGDIVSQVTDATDLNVDPANVTITPEIISTTLPGSVLPGATGTVKVQLTNNGNIKATETANVLVYMSADQSFGGDTQIIAAALITSTSLAPGSSKVVTLAVTVPEIASLSDGAGEYYLVATAQYDGDDTEAASTDTIRVDEPFVDLVPSFYYSNLESDIIPGDSGKVIVTVTNEGNIAAAGTIEVTLYASPDGTVGSGTQLGEPVQAVVNLAANTGYKNFTFTFDVPMMDVDDYQLVAEVTVVDGIDEDPADEDNNVEASAESYAYDLVFGTFGDRKNDSLRLVDPGSGEEVIFYLSGEGYGRLTFNDAAGAFDIEFTDTTDRTKVKIKTVARDAEIDINDITVSAGATNGDLYYFSAPDVNLIGDFTIDGGIRKLYMGDVADAQQQTLAIGSVAVPGTSDKVKLDFADVVDLTITSDTPLTYLNVDSWTDVDGVTDDGVTAPWIGKLDSNGAFQADLTLADDGAIAASAGRVLSTAVIDGEITGSTWDLSGSVSKMTFRADVDGLDIMAVSITTATLKGDLENSSIELSNPLGSRTYAIKTIRITGAMTNSELITLDNIGTITMGAMISSNIFAGVNDDVVGKPGVGDFIAPDAEDVQAFIKSFKLRSTVAEDEVVDDLFANSNVAAGTIKKAYVSDVAYDNTGTDFGFTADTALTKLYLYAGKTKIGKWSATEWTTVPDIDLDDFNVEIV